MSDPNDPEPQPPETAQWYSWRSRYKERLFLAKLANLSLKDVGDVGGGGGAAPKAKDGGGGNGGGAAPPPKDDSGGSSKTVNVNTLLPTQIYSKKRLEEETKNFGPGNDFQRLADAVESLSKDLEKKMAAYDTDLKKARDEVKDGSRLVGSLEKERDDLKKKVTDLQTTNQTLTQLHSVDVGKVKADAVNAQLKLEECDDKLKAATGEFNLLNQAYAQTQGTNARMRQQLDDLQKEISSTRKRSEGDMASLVATLDSTRAERDNALKTIEAQETQLNNERRDVIKEANHHSKSIKEMKRDVKLFEDPIGPWMENAIDYYLRERTEDDRLTVQKEAVLRSIEARIPRNVLTATNAVRLQLNRKLANPNLPDAKAATVQ